MRHLDSATVRADLDAKLAAFQAAALARQEAQDAIDAAVTDDEYRTAASRFVEANREWLKAERLYNNLREWSKNLGG